MIDDNSMERIDDFLRFVESVIVRANDLQHLRTMASMDLFSSLTTLRFWFIDFNEHQLHGLENIQKNIEFIYLSKCTIAADSVAEFFTSCPKLKFLRMNDMEFGSPTVFSSLLQRTFPMLGYFDDSRSEGMAPELLR